MMFPMTDRCWDRFGEFMDTVDPVLKRNIAYNIRCYEFFLTYPDDAPKEEIEIVKKAAGQSDD